MGSMQKMSKRDAVAADAFYGLIDAWFKTTDEATIGDAANYQGRTPWVWVNVGGQPCRLHADTTRDGVSQLLALVRDAEGPLEWHVVANGRGNFNKIAFGPAKITLPGVFLYLHSAAHRGRRLL